MAWTFTIGDTVPKSDNPLNLQTDVVWTNSDTSEVITTRPYGNDINLAIKSHCRAMLNNVLPARDAAIAVMGAMKGQALDLAFTEEELAAQAVAQAQADLQSKIRDAQIQALAATSPAVADALAAVQAAQTSLETTKTAIPVVK